MADQTTSNPPLAVATASEADTTMRQAVDRFRARMSAANRQFIQDRIAEIEARGLANEQEKIQRMAEWRHFGALDTDEEPGGCNNPAAERTTNRFRRTRRLEEVPALAEDALPLFAIDGIYPTRLRTDEARQIYLDTLQEVFQRQAEEWAAAEGEDPPGSIPRCDELGRFLTYAHEVADPDFRRSGVAPFEAGLYVMSGQEEVLAEGLDSSEQRERYHERVHQECARLRENLEDDQVSRLINKISIIAAPDCDMEVKAGLVTGEGYVGHYPRWYSAYLYCRQRPDDDEDEETQDEDDDAPDARNIQDWGWRVVFMEFEGDSYEGQVLYGRKPRFDSIPEFLDWYSSWPDHLDARALLSLRRHAHGCETDCESDCEDHIQY
ncbi:hypothetical protein BDV41DRAFT_196703 [Aspergillus transmontanensis]|uniref:Uncharacterized protein n=1 Tax=Aspergillus transmontanensis TaxID=1034304 RepID=A0A5N6W3I0_9EURO|nr:hypothetical protein BDV41DRAFT_196703 [Aspergillus transmontanensis]